MLYGTVRVRVLVGWWLNEVGEDTGQVMEIKNLLMLRRATDGLSRGKSSVVLIELLAGTQRRSPKKRLEILLVGDHWSWDKGSGGVFKVNPSVSSCVIRVHWWFHCMRYDIKEDWQVWSGGWSGHDDFSFVYLDSLPREYSHASWETLLSLEKLLDRYPPYCSTSFCAFSYSIILQLANILLVSKLN